jgi:quinohemoprotein ethanol dehydrogenase
MQTVSVLLICLIASGCASQPAQRIVDDAALRAADADRDNWLTYGRTYGEQRFSPLTQINEQSVGTLGLAWSIDLGTLRGVESTPIVSDGVMYFTSAWSLVYIGDAATGRLLWTFDPHDRRMTRSSSAATS